jgi:hypothetical protein
MDPMDWAPEGVDHSDQDGRSDPYRDLTGDERMYTGEPVETDEGVRRPQQMSVGKDNVEGGGEFPDPNTPPRAPAPGAFDP